MNEEIIMMLMPYIISILATVLTAIASYVGLNVKNIYSSVVNTRLKKQIVEDTCKYVEQIYKDLHGKEKLEKAIEAASAILNEKQIPITELELRVLIESTVKEFSTQTAFTIKNKDKTYTHKSFIDFSNDIKFFGTQLISLQGTDNKIGILLKSTFSAFISPEYS